MAERLEEIWIQFHREIGAFIRSRVKSEALAEDILQDVFVKIHAGISALRNESELRAWIYQIARNRIVDSYRARTDTVELSEMLTETIDEQDKLITNLAPSVRKMVLQLPPLYRDALLLTEYDGLTQRQVAERLGLSISAVKSRVQRAREKLKEMLLACCHFEISGHGKILDYQPRCAGCCEAEESCP
ncbi:MAG: RNA polymerase sigma factor SigZ [Rhizobacter sp.]|nr:RNA polymerase sigma factor SigZ [Chlorobiales bacterium]